LKKDEIEEAIKKPAELVGMDVEPKLVAQMAEDFLRNPGSLPLSHIPHFKHTTSIFLTNKVHYNLYYC
jgi:hypothetical protein